MLSSYAETLTGGCDADRSGFTVTLIPMPDFISEPASLVCALRTWYEVHGRDLPMRRPDVTPWGSLVFEVMSQQTPIPRVQPIWQEWMRLWPTPADLAAESPAVVLVNWRTLGYPSRALRLRECAQTIASRPGGQVPAEYEELLALPGIGPYTASAVASFQFHARIPVLDTNVRRVFARVISGVEFAPKSAPTRKEVESASRFLPEDGQACSWWNVAIMEFGALVCTQRKPQCEECPIRSGCAWAASGFPPAAERPRGQAWKGTDRQARGRLMGVLRQLHEDSGGRDSDLSAEDAVKAATLPQADLTQAHRVIEALVKDGMIVRDTTTGRISLPI